MIRFGTITLAIGLMASISAPEAIASVTLTSTEVIFNFDFTSLTPSPPYTSITFGATFDPSDPVSGGDDIETLLYGGLDGTNLLQVRDDTNCCFFNGGTTYGPLTTANPIFDPMLDGVFSIGFEMLSGTASLASVYATGLGGPTITITPTAPEPASLVLMATGLVGSIAFRRARRRAPISSD